MPEKTSLRFRIPIGWKITAVVTVVFTLLSFTSIIFTRSRFALNLTQEFQSKGIAIAQAIAISSEDKLVSGNLESVQSFVDSLKIIHGVAYIYLQGSDGNVLVHTFAVQFPKELLAKNPVKGDEKYHVQDFSLAGVGDVMEVAVPILFGSAGNVHVGMDRVLIRKELRSVTTNLIIMFAGAFLLGVVLLHLAVRFILMPLRRILHALRRAGEGDLSAEVKVTTRDEFADLARETNAARTRLAGMIQRVRQAYESIRATNYRITQVYSSVLEGTGKQGALAGDTMASVRHSKELVEQVTESIHVLEKSTGTSVSAVMELGASIEEVSSQSENLYKSVGETNLAIQDLSSTIEEILRNLTTLSKASEDTASAMSEMGASVEQVRIHAESTAEDADSMNQVAEQGVRASRAAIEGINAIKESSGVVTQLISTLTRRIEEIDAILKFITDITGKTNLLALNAAIIAAQAGAQGKGFGVVADEINDLAQNTNAQTKKISAVIEGIRGEVKRTEKAIYDSNLRVGDGVRLTEQTGSALEKILENTNRVSERVREIARTTAEQAKTGKQVMETAEHLAISVKNIKEAGQRQADSGQKILQMAKNVEAVADRAKNSTREQTATSRIINADLGRISQTIAAIARAMEEQDKSGQKVFSVTRDLSETIEKNQKSIHGLQDVIAVLEERMASLKTELEAFTLKQG